MNTISTSNYDGGEFEESELDNHWIIDRTPDFTNRISLDLNEIFINQSNINRTPSFSSIIQVGEILDIRNDIYDDDDFIPFLTEREPLNYIDIKVEIFNVLEEDRNCCICMEKKEFQKICMFNCLHKFCNECTLTHIRRNAIQSSCPLCRRFIRNISVQVEDIREMFI